MSKSTASISDDSLFTDFLEPPPLSEPIKPVNSDDSIPTQSLSSDSNNNSRNDSTCSSSISATSLAKALTNATSNANAIPPGTPSSATTPVSQEEQASIETPLNETPYVVGERIQVVPQSSELSLQDASPPSPQSSKKATKKMAKPQQKQPKSPKKPSSHRSPRRRESQRTPRVTAAAAPFQRTIPPTSFLRDELQKDPAYRHSLKAGTLWQSLAGQHVRLPALWFDGEEPARPYLGCEDPLKRNKWSYFGRHRVAGDPKLNNLVKRSCSSGKLLLHIVCVDSETFEPTEDIVVGVFHPNAEGIREHDNEPHRTDNRHEDCRDVWIGHRSRSVPHQGRRMATRIESLLRYLHRNKVDKCPLGSGNEEHKGTAPSSSSRSTYSNNSSKNSKYSVDNHNINAVFGSRPPRHTLFVPEEKLHSLLLPKHTMVAAPPASVILLRNFLR